jgi:hypothetical protein
VSFSRLSLDGYGARQAGSFAGKAVEAHPVGVLSRLALDGYGGKRAGPFSGKAYSAPSYAHPVGRLSRLAMDGYGARRAGVFAGKQATEEIPVIPPVTGGILTHWQFAPPIFPSPLPGREEDEAILIALRL